MNISEPRPSNIYRDILMYRLDELHTHLQFSHSLLIRQIEKLELERPKKFDSEVDLDYDSSLLNTIFDFASTAQTIYHSFIVSYYSFFEHFLIDICNHLHSKHNINLKANDLKGDSSIDQAKKYLEKVVKYQFREETKNRWEEINDLRLIRNSIIHQLSNVYKNQEYKSSVEQSKQEKRLINILSKERDCTFDLMSGSFTLNFEFVKKSGALIESFLLELTEDLCKEE